MSWELRVDEERAALRNELMACGLSLEFIESMKTSFRHDRSFNPIKKQGKHPDCKWRNYDLYNRFKPIWHEGLGGELRDDECPTRTFVHMQSTTLTGFAWSNKQLQDEENVETFICYYEQAILGKEDTEESHFPRFHDIKLTLNFSR